MPRLLICCSILALTLSAAPALAGGSSGSRSLDVKCFNTSTNTYCGSFTQSESMKSDMGVYCSKLAAVCSDKFPDKCPGGQARAEFTYYFRDEKRSETCD